ncbi:MAG: NAD+ synthase [Dehalococcoidia bacterium]
MRTLRVALAQLNPTVGDLAGNATRILEVAREAATQGADVVAFPELALTGYPPEDLLVRQPFVDDATRALAQLAADAAGLPPLIVGCLEFTQHLYNAAAVIHDGRVIGTTRKHYLPNYGVFDEARYFQPGEQAPVFRIGGADVGVSICEDAWYPGGPMREQALAGATVIININGSPYYFDKAAVRERMLATRATDNGVTLCYVNMVGGQDELVFDGNSVVLGPGGDVIARGASMAEGLLVVDVPVDRAIQAQLHSPLLRRDRVGRETAPPILVTGASEAHRAALPAPTTDREDPLREAYNALVLGTRDYLRKTGFRDALVAVSGGIDSAIVAAIAVDAIGADHVRGVAMPSRYSSDGSVADARALADALGIELVTLPIEGMHAAAIDTLTNEFAGTAPGVAEEGSAASHPGLLIMALSNKTGAIVLTTGNKSEYACGYATLYGDMAGGFAVIKDVPKAALVYRLARWRNTVSPVIPVATIEKPPSAELRPDQLDTDSLPPYEVLDPIIEAYVEDDLPLDAIVALGHDEATARRVIDMINRNEYKRRQSPPGVKVTTRAFGRDRRLPLANGYRGY